MKKMIFLVLIFSTVCFPVHKDGPKLFKLKYGVLFSSLTYDVVCTWVITKGNITKCTTPGGVVRTIVGPDQYIISMEEIK